MSQTLVIGADGQLGQELVALLKEKGMDFYETTRKDLDITDSKAVQAIFYHLKPKVVYLCAAYTAVDEAEGKGKKLNWQVNVEGTENVARAASKYGATLIFLSTDYIFNAKDDSPLAVDEKEEPINAYGLAKAEAERRIREICQAYYIVRTSWVIGVYGHNFLKTMCRLAKTNQQLTVVDDQRGRPTWTKTLGRFLIYLQESGADYGTYHLANEGSCSWYELASYILKDQAIEVVPVTSEAYKRPAKRPAYSILDLSKTKALGFKIETWQEAVDLILKDLSTRD
ncbi:dTDP-4-dehydrorhamnose reductase [Atopobacter sp. AH10]|uniref:dTDP-4-dehydrorhamnose reductase n=1 Tax=Atopobacter sp. AH10 TaxID=2315861 RepID=UPI000EF27C87|nr:dTDP-4-dehydrorhamnose reductase [Atopobacter sp. AH10]RLK63647.1 dTDP-4-dehydrorhamnose reductase [Atopobacter sp. AH10]